MAVVTDQPPTNLVHVVVLRDYGSMHSELAKIHALQALIAGRRLPHFRSWHVWTVTVPRRSITGRLVWGTVWRRNDNGRWIYKQYHESADIAERRRAVWMLVAKNEIRR